MNMSGWKQSQQYARQSTSSRTAARLVMVRRSPMRHLTPPRRGRLPLLALAMALLAPIAPAARAQTPAPPTVFTYHDAQGQGRFLLYDAGADDATGGRTIKVSLTQNGLSYYG